MAILSVFFSFFDHSVTHVGIFLGFLSMRVAILKTVSRQTTSMTPRDPPPSKDKIDAVFRRFFVDEDDDDDAILLASVSSLYGCFSCCFTVFTSATKISCSLNLKFPPPTQKKKLS